VIKYCIADPYFMDPLFSPATQAGIRAVSKRVASAASSLSAFVDKNYLPSISGAQTIHGFLY